MNVLRTHYEITGIKLNGQLLSGVASISETLDRNLQNIIKLTMLDGTCTIHSGMTVHSFDDEEAPWMRVGPVEVLIRRTTK